MKLWTTTDVRIDDGGRTPEHGYPISLPCEPSAQVSKKQDRCQDGCHFMQTPFQYLYYAANCFLKMAVYSSGSLCVHVVVSCSTVHVVVSCCNVFGTEPVYDFFFLVIET